LVKNLWMRVLYGSTPFSVAQEQLRAPTEYGQAWDTKNATRFIKGLPWFEDVNLFLRAGQWLGRNADPFDGVVFADPFDGAVVRWNPVLRERKRIREGYGDHRFEFEISIPVGLPNSSGDYPVDSAGLQKKIAPCLVHTLDAMFSALVIERLHSAGVQDFVAIHDAWMLPETMTLDPSKSFVQDSFDTEIEMYDDAGYSTGMDPTSGMGRRLIELVLNDAAKEWFERLEPVYDWLVERLDSSPHAEFARGIRDRWRARLETCRADPEKWPRLRAT
jgi:hypothetical protein